MPNVILKIRRHTPTRASFWEEFEVGLTLGMTVSGALKAIRQRPVNRDGVVTTPVVWDGPCAPGICGTCQMIINGQAAAACGSFVEDLEQPIRLEPLSKFSVVRDLVVDRSKKNQPVQKNPDTFIARHLPFLPHVQSDELANATKRCLDCQACVEACPQTSATSSFAGPYTLLKSYSITPSAPKIALSDYGILGCDNTQNCVRVCPQEIPITEMIARQKRRACGVFFKELLG